MDAKVMKTYIFFPQLIRKNTIIKMYFCNLSYSRWTKILKWLLQQFSGLEGVLAEELRKLGARDVKEGIRSVYFRGDKGFMYKANIALRTAIRILKPIKRSKIFDEEDLI